MSLYVFVSKECAEQAKLYNLEDCLSKLKFKVEQEQQFLQFEIFEYPYYVKKHLGYNFRLFARMTEIVLQGIGYRVLVFLKLFKRGDKDYALLNITAKNHGEFLYQQLNIEAAVTEYLLLKQSTEQLQNVVASLTDNHLKYLQQHSRVNLLNLQKNTPDNCYIESVMWHYQGLKYLNSQDLNLIYQRMLSVLETSESQSFNYKGLEIEFIYEDNCSRLNLSHEQPSIDQYARYLPIDLLLEPTIWQLVQHCDLPLMLNDFQYQAIDSIFYRHQPYPLLMNAPSNFGKTSLLAILYVHFLMAANFLDDQNICPCLLITSTENTSYLRQNIEKYIDVLQQYKGIDLGYSSIQIQRLLQRSCLSLNDAILQSLSVEQQQKFLPEYYIDAFKFEHLWQQQFGIHHEISKHYSAHLCWYVIYYFIKGYQLQQDKASILSVIVQIGDISEATFNKIYDHVWKNWYQPLCESKQYWDDQDLILAAYAEHIHLTEYAALLCDDSQQLSRNSYRYILQSCTWLKAGAYSHIADIPLIFTGNYAASYPITTVAWYRELSAVLQENLTHGMQSKALQTQIYDFYDSFSHPQTLFLHQQGQNTQGFKSKLYLEPAVAEFQAKTEILLIAETQQDLLSALLRQQHIALLVNTTKSELNMTLKQHPAFKDIFEWLSVEQIPDRAYSTAQLPQKHYAIALLDFVCPQVLSSEISPYILEQQLNLLAHATQQALNQVLIIASEQVCLEWQRFFEQSSTHSILCRQAKLKDIVLNVLDDQQQLADLKQQQFELLQHYDPIKIQLLIQQSWQSYQFEEYFKLCIQSSLETGRYAEYFAIAKTDQQREWMIQALWKHQYGTVLLQHQQHVPPHLYHNILALQLAELCAFQPQHAMQILQVMQQYQQQLHEPEWQSFWLILIPKILNKIRQSNIGDLQDWVVICDAIKLLQQLNYDISYDLSAFCAYQRQDFNMARMMWEQAKNSGEITQLPKNYYHLKLQTTDDIFIKLDCLMALGQTHQLTIELKKLNLNDLQQQYWEQILDYLDEQHELKPVLKQLLPSITSQDILEKLYRFSKNHESDKFAARIQRFKTLQACLNSDWDVVIERLAHYVPIRDDNVIVQKLSHNFGHVGKARTRGKKINSTYFNEELIEILYALNLNSAFSTAINPVEHEQYQQNEKIVEIFNLIRQNFAITDHKDLVWRIGFPAIMSLCHLVEKSPEMSDPVYLYAQLVVRPQKDTLTDFAIERLYAHLQRLKYFNDVDEDLTKRATKLEFDYKKLIQARNLSDRGLDFKLAPLKQIEEIAKAILALSNQENAELQRREREEAQRLAQEQAEEQAQAEAEAKRLTELKMLFDLEEQRRLEQNQLTEKSDHDILDEQQIAEVDIELSESPVEAPVKQHQFEIDTPILESQQLPQQQNTDQNSITELNLLSSDDGLFNQNHHQINDEVMSKVEDNLTQQMDTQVLLTQQQVLSPLQGVVQVAESSLNNEMEEAAQFVQNPVDSLVLEEQLNCTTTIIEQNSSQTTAKIECEKFNEMTADPQLHSTAEYEQTSVLCSESTGIDKQRVAKKAITELEFFGARIFVSRLHQRLNIEDAETGERWSLNLKTNQISSDWPLEKTPQGYLLAMLNLSIRLYSDRINVQQLQHGIDLNIYF